MFQYSIKRKQSPKFSVSVSFVHSIFVQNQKLKIDVNFLFFQICNQKKYESAKSKIFDIFPLGRILKHNAYFYFNPVKNEKKNQTERQLYFSDNVAVCGMA